MRYWPIKKIATGGYAFAIKDAYGGKLVRIHSSSPFKRRAAYLKDETCLALIHAGIPEPARGGISRPQHGGRRRGEEVARSHVETLLYSCACVNRCKRGKMVEKPILGDK